MNDVINQPAKPQELIPAGERSAPDSAPATGRPHEIPNPQPGSEDASNRYDPSREQSRADAIPIRALAPTRAEPPHSEERPDPSTGLDPVADPGPLFGDPTKTPSHPSTVRPLTTSNVDTGPQYPDDTDEELKGIADGIINSRATSIPARQVKANASRIRGLLKKTCNVKEIYNHLVREGRVDPTKVSYKQFADQVSKLQG